jgi:hypothetical protein
MLPAEGEKMKIVNYGIRKMEIETRYLFHRSVDLMY